MHIAIVTMVNDEDFFLPLWISHYSKVPGAKLIVVDHGSTDGSTDNLPAHVDKITLPQSKPYEEIDRSNSISELQHALLNYYECVIYTDVDEFLVVDPALEMNLIELVQSTPAKIIAPTGLEVLHRFEAGEADLDTSLPLLTQRSYAYFHSNYCKPAITRKQVIWMRGFHGCEQLAYHPSGLYLFHLAFADLAYARARMVKRNKNLSDSLLQSGKFRKQPKNTCSWGAEDEEVLEHFQRLGEMPLAPEDDFDFSAILHEAYEANFHNYGGNLVRVGARKGTHLHRIPERFHLSIPGIDPDLLTEPQREAITS